jgi:hypothetical protein
LTVARTTRTTEKSNRGYRASETEIANYDLNATIDAVQELRTRGITSGAVGEVAKAVAGDAKATTFKNKIYAAAKYGLVRTQLDRGNWQAQMTVLPLAEQVLDPERGREARVRAFLNVQLNRAVYERFRDRPLPSPNELTAYMERDLGISPGQLTNARQVLLRSARQAGFFDRAPDRLAIPPDVQLPEGFMVEPIETPRESLIRSNGTSPEPNHGADLPGFGVSGLLPDRFATSTPAEPSAVPTKERVILDITSAIDPVVAAHLQKIPPMGATWPKHKVDRWLHILGDLLQYAYNDDDDDQGTAA